MPSVTTRTPDTGRRSCERFHVFLPPLDLAGELRLPERARAMVIFAHGSGSSRLSPRNIMVAEALNDRGIATLLFDLLSEAEANDRANVFDIPLLADRLAEAVRWTRRQPRVGRLPLGLFGASTGAAAALIAAQQLEGDVGAVVSRGGRPDLAAHSLSRVTAPTLLIVGGADGDVITLNEQALARLQCIKQIVIVPGATHLFPEPGALEQVIDHAASWFNRHLVRRGGATEQQA